MNNKLEYQCFIRDIRTGENNRRCIELYIQLTNIPETLYELKRRFNDGKAIICISYSNCTNKQILNKSRYLYNLVQINKALIHVVSLTLDLDNKELVNDISEDFIYKFLSNPHIPYFGSTAGDLFRYYRELDIYFGREDNKNMIERYWELMQK